MDVHDCDNYWLQIVAGIAITRDELVQMGAAAARVRAAWAEYDQAQEQEHEWRRRAQELHDTRPAEYYGTKKPLLSRDECEERSRQRNPDLTITRRDEDVFLIQTLSSAARIAFQSRLGKYESCIHPGYYQFTSHDMPVVAGVVLGFNLTCMGMAQGGVKWTWPPEEGK